MNDLIEKIIEIENKAQKVIKEAKNEKEHLDEIIKKTIEDMKSDVEKRAEDKCHSIKNIEDTEADSAIATIEKEKKRALEKLESIYKSKCDEWVEQIVSEITEA